MWVLIIILVVVFIIIWYNSLFFNKIHSDEELINYSEQLEEMSEEVKRECYIALATFTDTARLFGNVKEYKNIENASAYKISIRALIDALYEADRKREIMVVNALAYYMVKYYTKLIIKYGSNAERGVLVNSIKLLKLNGFLKDESDNIEEIIYTCENCKKQIDADATSCPNCGSEFVDDDEEID